MLHVLDAPLIVVFDMLSNARLTQARPRMSVSERTSPDFGAVDRGVAAQGYSSPRQAPAVALPSPNKEDTSFSSPSQVIIMACR